MLPAIIGSRGVADHLAVPDSLIGDSFFHRLGDFGSPLSIAAYRPRSYARQSRPAGFIGSIDVVGDKLLVCRWQL